jgi:hypothetical protein
MVKSVAGRSWSLFLGSAVGALVFLAAGVGHSQEKAKQGRLAPLPAGVKVDDALLRTLRAGPDIPDSVFRFRARLLRQKGTLKTHIVANGGHENPFLAKSRPIFMCFETYAGPAPAGDVEEDELFLGFFLAQRKGILTVSPGFVELIAWDRTKEAYNFWELIDTVWHYRGDSNDVLADIAAINVGHAKPAFAGKLRCSGCHTLGGPVMKELEPPHNDWWTTKYGLEKGGLKLEPASADPAVKLAAELFSQPSDASNLSRQVKKGIDRLVRSRAKQGVLAKNLKLSLRSLFTTMEMNLVSDAKPFKERKTATAAVDLPLAFFIDTRLAGSQEPIAVSFELYQKALGTVKSRFAPDEGNLEETRHAFLVPARSYIDNRVIDALIEQKLLDDDLVAAVLAMDFSTPVFSAKRGGLLKYVPEKAKNLADLRRQLQDRLKEAKDDQAARALLVNLTHNAARFRDEGSAFRKACLKASTEPETVVGWLRLASQRRQEIVEAQTAQHQEGNIVERGFRLIFPADFEKRLAGRLWLDPLSGRAGKRP